METPLQRFLRKTENLELSNVSGHVRRTASGKLVNVSAHTRKDPAGIADELSENSEDLNEQQTQLSIDYLRVNYTRMSADQQKAARRLLDTLEDLKRRQAAAADNLKHSVNPRRGNLDWNDYRQRLRGLTG